MSGASHNRNNMLNLREIITPRDLGSLMQTGAWDRFIKAVDVYLHGGAGDWNNLEKVIQDHEVEDIVKTLRDIYRNEWGADKKTLYRGMAIISKKEVKKKGSMWRKMVPLTQKEMPRLARKKVGETFRFTEGHKYPLQHWTHDIKVARDFAERSSFRWHNEIVISADIPVDMVVFDTLYMHDTFMTTKMMQHVKKNEKEVIVQHNKAIICRVEQNHGH